MGIRHARAARGAGLLVLAALSFSGCSDPGTTPSGSDSGADAATVDAASHPDAPGRDTGSDAPCPDADGDGAEDAACGGTDCNDTDAHAYPGNTEVCDGAGHDEDCDPTTYGFRDSDHDDHGDALCCNGTGAGAHCGDDCNDMRPSAHPTAPEVCDGIDNDCDTSVDEAVLVSFWTDTDHDGHGTHETTTMMTGCPGMAPSGYAESDDDCDDARDYVHPGLPESCDRGADGMSHDENCVGGVDEGCACVGSMTQSCAVSGAVGACASGVQTCVAGRFSDCSIMPATEVCNDVDDDCDGTVDDGVRIDCYADVDNDHYALPTAVLSRQCRDAARPAYGECPFGFTSIAPTAADHDCNGELRADQNTHAAEVCNRVDDDCSGTGGVETSEDADDDMHTAAGFTACSGGFPIDDCNDASGATHPGAAETCDGLDSDCSSGGGMTAIDEDRDRDGHTAPTHACTGGLPKDDCVDTNASVHPGAGPASTPYCANGATPMNCTSYWTCTPGSCAASATRATFDFNCSGTQDVPPVGGMCGTGGFTCSGTVMNCPDQLQAAHPVADCGQPVTYTNCVCGPGLCGPSGTLMSAMPCG